MGIIDRIMEKYDYEFGYVKACFVSYGVIALGALIFGIINWDNISEAEVDGYVGLGIACGIMIIIGAIIYGVTLNNLPGENPILLALGMTVVGFFTSAFLGLFIIGGIANIFLDNDSSNTANNQSDTSIFTKRYMRDSDGEYFYLYSDNGSWAVLASESKNATTVNVHNAGYDSVFIQDDAGNHYRPL